MDFWLFFIFGHSKVFRKYASESTERSSQETWYWVWQEWFHKFHQEGVSRHPQILNERDARNEQWPFRVANRWRWSRMNVKIHPKEYTFSKIHPKYTQKATTFVINRGKFQIWISINGKIHLFWVYLHLLRKTGCISFSVCVPYWNCSTFYHMIIINTPLHLFFYKVFIYLKLSNI